MLYIGKMSLGHMSTVKTEMAQKTYKKTGDTQQRPPSWNLAIPGHWILDE